MPAIPVTNMSGPGVRAATEFTLTASDTLAYDPGSPGSVLTLRNPTGGALSPVMVGSTASASIPVSGFGTVSAASYAVGSIPAGQARVIPLDSIKLFLEGTVTITGGVGLIVTFLRYN
jgi:hypothetical protein